MAVWDNDSKKGPGIGPNGLINHQHLFNESIQVTDGWTQVGKDINARWFTDYRLSIKNNDSGYIMLARVKGIAKMGKGGDPTFEYIDALSQVSSTNDSGNLDSAKWANRYSLIKVEVKADTSGGIAGLAFDMWGN